MNDSLRQLVNALVLPPQLPQKDESSTIGQQAYLINFWHQSVCKYASFLDNDQCRDLLLRYSQITANIHASSGVNGVELEKAMATLDAHGAFVVLVKEQNCGILFHHDGGPMVTLEMFEASASNSQIMGSARAPQRDFPGLAIELPQEFVCAQQTVNEFSRTVLELAAQPVEAFIPQVRKAGQNVTEIRDTPNPSAITGALAAALLAFGNIAAVDATRKKVRDEVCWKQSLLPWRRPPIWAVLRIATQRVLERVLGGCEGRRHYKNLQVVILSDLCNRVTASMPWSDQLYFTRTKLGRRLDKLHQENCLDLRVEKYAVEALTNANEAMNNAWESIVADSCRQVAPCEALSQRDTQLRLRNCNAKVSKELDGSHALPDSKFDGPAPTPLRQTIAAKCTMLEIVDFQAGEHNLSVSLYDFEMQVRRLDCQSSLENVRAIKQMFRKYSEASERLYIHSADHTGVRLLTLMLLWTELDRIALRLEPSLRQLSPDIPKDFMRHLRLTALCDIRRVQQIEEYLDQRRNSSDSPGLSPFQDESMKSFACAYFDAESTGTIMRQTFARVQADTAELLRKKLSEWDEKTRKCQAWQEEANGLDHTYFENDYGDEIHSYGCRLCALQRRIQEEQITPFEEPLPRNEKIAKWMLFELLASEVIQSWREVTWVLINDLGRQAPQHEAKADVSCRLPSYSGLKSYHSCREGRLYLASKEKSFHVAHYGKPKKVNFTTFDKIHLLHGPRYFLLDSQRCVAVQELSSVDTKLFWKYTGILPHHGLYETSKQSIPYTSHTSNEVLSKQDRCPPSLSLFEFQAFNLLRSGEPLQWLNILTELASPSLRFAEDAPHLLLTQAVLEIGTHAEDGHVLRQSHGWLENAAFCRKLVELLERHVTEVGLNWNELTHLRTILILTLRLESVISQTKPLNLDCRRIRISIRQIARDWTRQLRGTISKVQETTDTSPLRATQLRAAMLCRATYTNTDDLNDWGDYLETGFVLARESPIKILDANTMARHEILHDWRMACELETRVSEACMSFPQQLSDTVGLLWPHGRSIRSWIRLNHPHSQWLWAQTEASDGIVEIQVHVNLLTGDLLIQGSRLGQLPDKYLQSALYREVLGARQFDVLPSEVKGMKFTAKMSEGDFEEVLFGWSKNDIRIGRKNTGVTDILLSRDTFHSADQADLDIPGPLLKNNLHWLCTMGKDVGSIHICPLERPLSTCATGDDWILKFHERQLIRSDNTIADPGSDIVRAITGILGNFERPENLIIWADKDQAVTVTLPRFGLNFSPTSSGQLRSPDLNGYIVSHQRPGTFVGLTGYLLLLDERTDCPFLVVPHGKITCVKQRQHVSISVNTSHVELCTFAKFVVNIALSRIDCSSEPKDMLMKAYLHAVSSGYVGDPLLGRRGTEEALGILQELIRQSYSPLDEDLHDLLKDLVSLTPTRKWYPKKLRVMETSKWRQDVPAASQRDEFRDVVAEIITRANQLRTFYQEKCTDEISLPHDGDVHLHRRACHRSRQCHPPIPRSSDVPAPESLIYHGRDVYNANDKFARAHELAQLVSAWLPSISSTEHLGRLLSGQGDLSGFLAKFRGTSTSSMFSFEVTPVIGAFLRMSIEATKTGDQTAFLFLFPFLGYLGKNSMEVLRSLLALAFNPAAKWIDLPRCSHCLRYMFEQVPSSDKIKGSILATDRQPHAPTLTRNRYEEKRTFQTRKSIAAQAHRDAADRQAQTMSVHVMTQWPCPIPHDSGDSYSRVSFSQAISDIRVHWGQRWHNWKFSQYCNAVSVVLRQGQDMATVALPQVPDARDRASREQSIDRSLNEMLKDSLRLYNPSTLDKFEQMHICDRTVVQDLQDLVVPAPRSSDISCFLNGSQLEDITDDPRLKRDSLRTQFTSSLSNSLVALRGVLDQELAPPCRPSDLSLDKLRVETLASERSANHKLSNLQQMAKGHQRFKYLSMAGLWPRMAAADFLQMLSTDDDDIQDLVRSELVDFALDFMYRQRLERVRLLHQHNEAVKFAEEIKNRAHAWDVHKYRSWLLLEIEMNACIRPEQVELALKMASSGQGINGIHQLQMGKGKSSLIIPMLAALLPQEDILVRIIVPKPLLHQMGAILRQRICRLLTRTLLHLPFSRATPKDADSLKAFSNLHQQVLESRGVVLALPEHLQSLQLSGPQCLLDGHIQPGSSLMNTYQWFREHCRDVLDECDQILAPRTQLIYPSGMQSVVEGGPRRWNMIAHILRVVFHSIAEYEKQHPEDLEVEPHRIGSVPFVHVRSQTAGDRFITFLVGTICDPDLSPLPLTRLSADELLAIQASLSHGSLSQATFDMLKSRFQDEPILQEFLILRGLLRGGILLLALQKRWNVQYGLDLSRCQIAVPYEARGIPTAASEYGHPDVALTLTFLAYYHQGLQKDQLRRAIDRLRLENDPSLEWSDWITYANNLPDTFRDWKAVNLEDEQLIDRLWHHLSHSIALINFYLHSIVFPVAAREFSRKLVSSSWDIPLSFPQTTTGFSGTNDNSMLMPESITPQELPSQAHTNAEVLWHLLQTRNRCYRLAADSSHKVLSVEALLDLVSDLNADVLLDAGALVLEMTNIDIAAAWLVRRRDKDAVAYFASAGVLMVLHRGGRTELLARSRYSSNLAGCLLYLDQEHCRGTDTKLPPTARAVLTIGPRQSKD